jgi:hypothetical protein
MLLTIGIILLICWAVGLFAFHAGGVIHVLIVLAVISIIFHMYRGSRRLV